MTPYREPAEQGALSRAERAVRGLRRSDGVIREVRAGIELAAR